MATGPRYRVPFRRRREKRTDYRSRKALLKSGLPRAIIRRSNKHIRINIANYSSKGDRIVVTAFSQELSSVGWKGNFDNTPGAYLTGLLAGKRCVAAGIKETVLDIGRHMPTRGSVIFAAMKGMIDAGVTIPSGEEILPSEERIMGKHLSDEIQSNFVNIRDKLQKEGEGAIKND